MVNPAITVSIPDAKVLSNGVDVNTVYVGYSPAATATLTAAVSGGSGSYTYKWSTGATTASIKVSPAAATTYTVTVTDAKGCSATAGKQVRVADIRCGNKMDKVLVCHGGNTLCIDNASVPAHLGRGDYLGTCTSDNSITMASKKAVDTEQEVTLSLKASPNPSTTYFKLNIIGSNVKDKVSILIIDEVGRPVETITAIAGQTLQIGDHYRAGVYFVQAIQGDKRVTVKLIKQAW